MIDLFYYVSPNARKIHMALEELGLAYEIRWVDITRGDQFEPEFLRVNPNGKIPAIVDHDGPGGALALFESAAILLYLAEKTGRLLPADPGARWEAICWTVWQVANQGPGLGQATHFHTYAPDNGYTDAYAQERFGREARRVYQVLEDRLRDREYLAGGEFSIADIACFPWTRLGKGQGIALADYPAVAEWSERISARPSARAKAEDRRSEDLKNFRYTPEQFRTLFGADSRADSKR